MIEGLIILLVSTDVITLRLLKGGRQLRVALKRRPSEDAGASQGGASVSGEHGEHGEHCVFACEFGWRRTRETECGEFGWRRTRDTECVA